MTYPFRFTPETCPIPDEVKADYVSILFCGLGKRTNDLTRYTLVVDGYTNLPSGTVRTVGGVVGVPLPCGATLMVSGFTETSFTQTLPPPPPYRMSVTTGKFLDPCL